MSPIRPDRRHSVVDPQLRVHGVGKLRVADAAIFPNITSANTNAPTIAVAHKAADPQLYALPQLSEHLYWQR